MSESDSRMSRRTMSDSCMFTAREQQLVDSAPAVGAAVAGSVATNAAQCIVCAPAALPNLPPAAPPAATTRIRIPVAVSTGAGRAKLNLSLLSNWTDVATWQFARACDAEGWAVEHSSIGQDGELQVGSLTRIDVMVVDFAKSTPNDTAAFFVAIGFHIGLHHAHPKHTVIITHGEQFPLIDGVTIVESHAAAVAHLRNVQTGMA